MDMLYVFFLIPTSSQFIVLEVDRRYPKYSRLTLLRIPLSPCVVRD
jgi:hypothetical protein